MSKVFDIGSGKDVDDIKQQEEEQEASINAQFKESVEGLLEEYSQNLDMNNFNSFCVCHTTKAGSLGFRFTHKNIDDLIKLQYVLKEVQEQVHDTISMSYGLRSYDEE